MSRSLSLAMDGTASGSPATKACAITTERVPGRSARSDRTRRIASVSVASWLRAVRPHAERTASGSR